MSSETITRNDLIGILNEILPLQSHTAKIGEVIVYAGSNEPNGWLKCDGRAVSRENYSALFSVIGTTYGSGDGSTTFNLPDLCGRYPIGTGAIKKGDTGPESYWGGVTNGEVNVSLGQRAGQAWHTLTLNELPSNAYYSNYTDTAQWGDYEATNAHYYRTRGGGQAHTNMSPFIGMNYLIYVGGDFAPIDTTPPMDDWIIEQGTDNDWEYRKWNNGTYEAWRFYQATGLNCTSSSAGTYYGGSVTLSFPSFHKHWLQAYATNGPSQSSGIYVYQVSANNGFRIDYRACASTSNGVCGANLYLRGSWVD